MPPESVVAAIEACNASQRYASFLGSLAPSCDAKKLAYDRAEKPLSKALFFHLARMKHAGWEHRVQFKRRRKHTLAEVFQDLLVFYLRSALPREFDITVEEPSPGKEAPKICPDILIRKGGRNHFVIEVKTTMGWNRPGSGSPNRHLTLEQKYEQLSGRIDKVAGAFGVPTANVIYIFEGPENLDAEFENLYWDRQTWEGRTRAGLSFPLSQIYPLFHKVDPYNWTGLVPKGHTKQSFCPPLLDDRLHDEGRRRICTPFEDIVELIRR